MNQKYTVLDVNSIEQGFFFSTLSVQENSVWIQIQINLRWNPRFN